MQGLPEPATAPLLERDRELERLGEAIRAAQHGTGAVVVEGSAGIGKTALLAATRQRARAAGMSVASARGSELERESRSGSLASSSNRSSSAPTPRRGRRS